MLIGFIAIQLAQGGTRDADPSGAMAQLARQPAGLLLMWCCAVACLALGIWQAINALFGYRTLPTGKRLGRMLSAAGQGIVFLALAVGFGSFALGDHTDSGTSTRDATARVMAIPGGRAVLIVVGAGIMVAGIVFAARGLLKSFTKKLNLPQSSFPRRVTVLLGVVGYAAKGISLVLVGLLVIIATIQSRPEDSTGLDGALKALRAQPYGVYGLLFIGIGLGCYGLYQMAKAPLARMD